MSALAAAGEEHVGDGEFSVMDDAAVPEGGQHRANISTSVLGASFRRTVPSYRVPAQPASSSTRRADPEPGHR